MSGTQRVSCALPTPARGYDQHWRHIIGSRSRGRLFWLRVEGVNAARCFFNFFLGLLMRRVKNEGVFHRSLTSGIRSKRYLRKVQKLLHRPFKGDSTAIYLYPFPHRWRRIFPEQTSCMFAAAHAGRALGVGSGHGLFAADLELDLLRSASAAGGSGQQAARNTSQYIRRLQWLTKRRISSDFRMNSKFHPRSKLSKAQGAALRPFGPPH